MATEPRFERDAVAPGRRPPTAAPQTRRELFVHVRDTLRGSVPRRPPSPPPKLLREFVRPPGASAESELISVCERCHACAEACPHDVIIPLGPAYGPATGTPALLLPDGPCHLCADLPCARACPSGALELVPIGEVAMGTAHLDPARCWSALGQPCDYCVKHCPVGELALHWNGRHPEVGIDHCTGCGVCVNICPAPGGALRVVPAHA
jgi:ferredoxin-type protein NapG